MKFKFPHFFIYFQPVFEAFGHNLHTFWDLSGFLLRLAYIPVFQQFLENNNTRNNFRIDFSP